MQRPKVENKGGREAFQRKNQHSAIARRKAAKLHAVESPDISNAFIIVELLKRCDFFFKPSVLLQ